MVINNSNQNNYLIRKGEMLKMTVEEKAAYKWALAEKEGPTCSKVLAEYIERNLENEQDADNIAQVIIADPAVKEVSQTIIGASPIKYVKE